ncbi:MAG: DUF3501 family protein [Gammaproteobacteria bacterium]|nr:MAG: DUF3501 family protein [Gammaproteobacteria bacterium]
MSQKLSREDLYSLEKYAEVRPEFRARIMQHKQDRRVPIGPNATLHFEDALTMQYQVQEMLRIERIFEAEGIQEELDAYNPLIPDGSNWKATFMVEFPDENERREQLKRLLGIEKHVWVQIGDLPRVTPIADEDLEREDEEKTSSVHFLRFELTPEMVQAVKEGADIAMGIDHPNYTHTVEKVPANVRDSLAKDLA